MVMDTASAEFDENLLVLNFTARLLTAFTNREILLQIAPECFADFAQSERVAIFTLSDEGERLEYESYFCEKKIVSQKGKIPLQSSLLNDVLSSKKIALYPIDKGSPLPLPSFDEEDESRGCLCLPIVTADLRSVGVVTIEVSKEPGLSFELMQHLRILTTILAVSLGNADLYAQVIKDGLTGAYVRKYGETRLTEELARLKKYPGSVAVVFLDIDHFKEINDSMGHETGDRALREFVQIIQTCIRKDIDLVCRYGGDEFIVILPNATANSAWQVAEKIRKRSAKRFSVEPFTKVPVTVAGGIAAADHNNPISAQELLRRADMMLYQAKRGGRNRIEIWKVNDGGSAKNIALSTPCAKN